MVSFKNAADAQNTPVFLHAHQHESNYRFFPFNVEDTSHVSKTESISTSTHALTFLNAALSPVYLNNPAFRLMKLDSKGSVADFDEYWLDLSSPQSKWKKLYTASDAYNFNSIWDASTASTLFKSGLVDLKDPALTSFCLYRLLNTSCPEKLKDPEDCKSKAGKYYCMMISTENKDYFNCMN